MPHSNIAMLQMVAEGLGGLKEQLVFVGGVVAELYANDPAATEIRATLDVDCVIEIASRQAYYELEENLRVKGFENDTSPGAPICRWIYKGIKVDVMPTDPDILGFSNKWYTDGIHSRIPKDLPNGTRIYIFSPEYFLASKFEAHKSRGGNDLRQSHDFEDIIYLFDNCLDIVDRVRKAASDVQSYLISECRSIIENSNLWEGIASALSYNSDYEGVDIIVNRVKEIATL